MSVTALNREYCKDFGPTFLGVNQVDIRVRMEFSVNRSYLNLSMICICLEDYPMQMLHATPIHNYLTNYLIIGKQNSFQILNSNSYLILANKSNNDINRSVYAINLQS